MTDVEYTEKALNHLEGLDPQVADRVMNKIDEATEWTEHRLYPFPDTPTASSALETTGQSSRGTGTMIFFESKQSGTVETSMTDTSRRNGGNSYMVTIEAYSSRLGL
jgi:hypothetical protein